MLLERWRWCEDLLAICSIPVVKKDRTRKALTMLLNAKPEKLFGEIGARFADFTRNMATAKRMTCDGLHYQEGVRCS